MARVRLVDVAAHVGVSAKTVSNVVNGTGMVSDEVRARILAVIEDLGYRPNLAARQLRGGPSGMVALVMPDLREPYFAEYASNFSSAAQRRGMTVVVAQTQGDRLAERRMSEGVGLPELEGLVLSPLGLTPEDIGERRSNVPLILIGEHGQSLATSTIPHVGVDNIAAAAAATDLLLDKGRRRIAVIGVQEHGSTATSRLRFEGYRRALAQAGIDFDPALVGHVEHFNRAEGSQAAARLLDAGTSFDGLFCFNDTLAFGALHTLAVRAIGGPDDVPVVGFDNIEEGRYSVPRFASVDTNMTIASDTILDIVAAPSGARPGGLQRVPFTVVDRDNDVALVPRSPTRQQAGSR
ncbi:MAG: LacI family transcriptional regulator [Phycicoccus sp.]|nr:LacI family transcriptional regulator [Phycicoccus sp.]